MEQKIELEIRLRELASQSLLEARDEIDVLEVEKSLLTSDQRMNCYASQLEQQRKQLSNPSLSTDSGRASKISNRLCRRDGSLAGARTAPPPADNLAPAGGQQDQQSLSTGTGSPSCSSPPKSSQSSSPSKLSPVAGESASSLCGSSSGAGQRRSNAQVVRQPSSTASNTLNRRRNGRLSNKSLTGPASRKARQRERLRQTITSQSNINCNMVADNKATLSLSELRIPLMWRDVDHFKGRGDYRRYAVFCLLKLGAQIYDTQLISDVDRQLTDLTFDDVIVFNNVEHEFELTLEVYSCVYLEQFSLASTPRKLKEKLSNSVSRAMGRRMASQTASAHFTKELEAYDKSYRFAMIASAHFGLADVSDSIRTYDLHLVSPEAHGRHSTSNQFNHPDQSAAHLTAHHSNSNNLSAGHYRSNHSGMVTASNQKDAHKNTLPLFGHFCCKLHIRPDVFDKCVKSGYLRIASINLPDLIGTKSLSRGDEPAGDSDRQPRRQQRVRGRSDSPANDESAMLSSSNDELLPGPNATGASMATATSTNDTGSMLRSALAASSKLAAISMSTATIHWALLRNFTLHLWQVDEQKLQLALRRGHAPQVDISCKQPFCITIDKFTRLLRVSNSSLTIETDKGFFVIAVHNVDTANDNHHQQDEIGQWLRPIEQMIYDSHIWSSALHHHAAPSQKIKYPT